MEALDEELRQADPAARLQRERATSLIMAMAIELPSQPARKRPWWKHWRITLPVGVVGVLALTGATLAVPFVLGIDGESVDIDARIPIAYVTGSGVSVDCIYGVFVSSQSGRTEEDERVAEFLADEDWSGIGQEVYDYAIAHPRTPQAGEVWNDDSAELRDAVSFKLAMTAVITAHLPPEMQGAGWASTDTCTGPFR